jgi:hypothetical protein
MYIARPERGISVKALYGGRFINPKATRKSMAGLEERLTAQFKDRVRLRTGLAKQTKKYGAAFVELVSKDKGAAEAVKEMRRLQTVAREHKVKSPPVEKVQERIFTGSIGATVGPRPTIINGRGARSPETLPRTWRLPTISPEKSPSTSGLTTVAIVRV